MIHLIKQFFGTDKCKEKVGEVPTKDEVEQLLDYFKMSSGPVKALHAVIDNCIQERDKLFKVKFKLAKQVEKLKKDNEITEREAKFIKKLVRK